jgi:hypothetical protein
MSANDPRGTFVLRAGGQNSGVSYPANQFVRYTVPYFPGSAGAGAGSEVPHGAYKAISLGPNHSGGPALVGCKGFGGSADFNGLLNIPTIAIGPNAPWIGDIDQPITAWVPSLSSVYTTKGLGAGFWPDTQPVVDLILWKELPAQISVRGPTSIFAALNTGTELFLPCSMRKKISLELWNNSAAVSSTTIKLSGFSQSIGFSGLYRRTYAGPFIIPIGGTYVANFSDPIAGPPLVAALSGENAFVPDGISILEAGVATQIIALLHVAD